MEVNIISNFNLTELSVRYISFALISVMLEEFKLNRSSNLSTSNIDELLDEMVEDDPLGNLSKARLIKLVNVIKNSLYLDAYLGMKEYLDNDYVLIEVEFMHLSTKFTLHKE